MRATAGAGRAGGLAAVLVLVSVGVLGCGSSARTSVTTTTTAARVTAGGGGGAGGGGLAGGGGAAGGGNGGGGKGAGSATGNPPTSSTSTTFTPEPRGPYTVKQLVSLGGEKISGTVCSTRAPFVVAAATSRVAWTFLFNGGHVTYAYNIPSAGESHSASGDYTLSVPDRDGTVHVSLTVSDHVAFKGFDGNIPLRYRFDLVPSGAVHCPGS